jgi:hypothetical protein
MKGRWCRRSEVVKCPCREPCECAYCPVGDHCTHEKNEEGPCREEECPRFDGKKWKKWHE